MIILVALAGVACWICSNPDVALSLILGQRTIYSSGYSESGFRQVRVGMTEEEVEGLIGSPIYKAVWRDQYDITWCYSKQVEGTDNYWRRWIHFRDGVVANIEAYFNID